MDAIEGALEQLARKRAAEKGCELVVREDPWEAVYEQGDAILGGRVVVHSGGPSPSRIEALQRLLAIDDTMSQVDEHTP